ncbi:MAG TPA: DoxX family protein [Gemmatimonadaceae bacterium]|nr:DoxX family protein [Gemmatimonadaceae bacterium]
MSRIIRKSGLLWTVQTLLALLFLFAGVSKFVMPPEMMQQGPIVLPLAFIRFIGVCEIAGALGLLLPGLLRVRRGLTPVAALGLVIIMSGATTITVEGGAVSGAVVPLVVGLLASVVAYGRSSWNSRLHTA